MKVPTLRRSLGLLVGAVLVAATAHAKQPFEYSCVGNEVHVQWCCPDEALEAVQGAQLVAALVCTENDFEFFRVLEEDQSVERTRVTVTGRQGEVILLNMVTGTLKIEMYPYQEEFVSSCSKQAEAAEENKKVRKWRKKILADLAAKKAAGECTRTRQDAAGG